MAMIHEAAMPITIPITIPTAVTANSKITQLYSYCTFISHQQLAEKSLSNAEFV